MRNSGSAKYLQVIGRAGDQGAGRGGGKEQQECEKGNHKPSSLRRQEDLATGYICVKQ